MTSDPYSVAIKNAFQGAAIPFTVTFYDTPPAADGTGGVAHDISQWHLSFTMKKKVEDSDSAAVFTLDWVIAAGAGTNGKATWTVPGASVALLEAKFLYYWDLRALVWPSTNQSELLAGTIYLNPSVGQRAIP
jgi:hypothetical protein